MKSIHRNAIFRILSAIKLSLAISAPVVLARSAILAQSQNQAPAPIRSEGHAVLISVAVRDATGESVDNLRKEDFTVADDVQRVALLSPYGGVDPKCHGKSQRFENPVRMEAPRSDVDINGESHLGEPPVFSALVAVLDF